MPRFSVDAHYCTRGGRPGRWSGTITAASMADALERARRIVERRHRGASKVDLHVVAETDQPEGE